MTNIRLKRLSLAWAIALFSQSLSGMEGPKDDDAPRNQAIISALTCADMVVSEPQYKAHISKTPYVLFALKEIRSSFNTPNPLISFPEEIVPIIFNIYKILFDNQGFCLDLTDSQITYEKFTQLPKIMMKGLILYDNRQLKDEALLGCTNLTYLNLSCHKLQDYWAMNRSYRNNITYRGIQGLTSLTRLNLGNNQNIQGKALENLTNLIELDLKRNNVITNKSLENLTNLTSLNLDSNTIITNEGIQPLTNLTSLNLTNNQTITNEALSKLPKLTYLIGRKLPT